MSQRTAHFDFRQQTSITITVNENGQEREIFIPEDCNVVGEALVLTLQELGYETTIQ